MGPKANPWGTPQEQPEVSDMVLKHFYPSDRKRTSWGYSQRPQPAFWAFQLNCSDLQRQKLNIHPDQRTSLGHRKLREGLFCQRWYVQLGLFGNDFLWYSLIEWYIGQWFFGRVGLRLCFPKLTWLSVFEVRQPIYKELFKRSTFLIR